VNAALAPLDGRRSSMKTTCVRTSDTDMSNLDNLLDERRCVRGAATILDGTSSLHSLMSVKERCFVHDPCSHSHSALCCFLWTHGQQAGAHGSHGVA
jgi:hypothetical protein